MEGDFNMIISNVEIAKRIEARGYDFNKALEGIDAGRTPDDEGLEITEEELAEIIDGICLSFEIDKEETM